MIAKVLPKSTLILSPHMGRALTEAALSGVPIVGYDYDWQREVLINNKTGCLVEHQNWNEMANEAEKILNDQTFAKMLGKNVREHIEKMMNPINLNAHEISYYNRLINS